MRSYAEMLALMWADLMEHLDKIADALERIAQAAEGRPRRP